MATRTVSDKHFEVVAAALLGRARLAISYYGRARDESNERKVSPQQLLHYRGNWYLIAYCHVRHGLRSFAMDSIQAANATQETAFEADAAQLEKFIGAGYGIYSGGDVQWARLRFTAPRSRWVAREVWHPEQKSQLASNGTLLLEVPFTDATELAMDILRHGKHVEVLEPQALREAVMHELVSASAMYSP
ncbi:helix-turn-helix transcriptional regulator [Tepidimonas aquatica]|uniref:WYL domain protein n=1 Tax=Tepidimonas aquatica TaxID=247482 RepID=A0A554W6C2_9BURK|nr:WYL domain-containing protein [Tepidimonas aquatica]TSE19129.1 WYL domain protein [Tepidimonas aquatica]